MRFSGSPLISAGVGSSEHHHRTKAASEKQNDLWCYRCDSMSDGDRCQDLQDNSTSLHMKCSKEHKKCQVCYRKNKRFHPPLMPRFSLLGEKNISVNQYEGYGGKTETLVVATELFGNLRTRLYYYWGTNKIAFVHHLLREFFL